MSYDDRDRYNDRGCDDRGYYPNQRDNNGYDPRDRRGGRDYGGYNDNYRGQNSGGGYNNRRPQRNFNFGIGEKVIHIHTGTELYVISYGKEQLECRKPDLSCGYFYEHELRSANPTAPNSQNAPNFPNQE